MEERRGDEGRSGGAFRNGTGASSTSFVSRMMLLDSQHDLDRIAQYLSVVYYYLVGTSFETGTREEKKRTAKPVHSEKMSENVPSVPGFPA